MLFPGTLIMQEFLNEKRQKRSNRRKPRKEKSGLVILFVVKSTLQILTTIEPWIFQKIPTLLMIT